MGKRMEPRQVFQIKVKFHKSHRGNYVGKLRFGPGSLSPDKPFLLSDESMSDLEELIGGDPQYVRVGTNRFLAPDQTLLPTRDGQKLENFVRGSLKQKGLYLVEREGVEYLTDYESKQS